MRLKKLHFFVLLFIAIVFFGCKESSGKYSLSMENISFKDIPGVTEEEIKAIEALQKQNRAFVYGMLHGTEAFPDKDGIINGFSALYCEWLTGLFGIPFVPKINKWNDLITGLENGTIDFTGELTPDDERRGIYFMTDAITARGLKYFRIEGSLPLPEIETVRPLRLVFLEGKITYDNVVNSDKYDVFESFFVNDSDMVYELLKNGIADAFVEESPLEAAFDVYSDIIAEDFFPLIFSPVSMSTQNPDLVPVISIVQKALHFDGFSYLSQLRSQGHREYLKQKLFTRFTEEELKFINDNPIITFAAEIDNYPVSFYNKQEKQWQGISFDALNEIQALTGISFEIADTYDPSWAVLIRMLEDGRVPMVTELIRTEERRRRFIWPETNILNANYAILSKSEYPNLNASEVFFAKIGITRDTAYAEAFRTLFPYHENIVEYDTMDLAVNALENDKIDMVMASQAQFLFISNYLELPGYKINILLDHTLESTFGFNKDEEILCSIVNKALSLIDIKGISEDWMKRTFDYQIKILRAQTQMLWANILSAVIVLILVFVIIIFFIELRRRKIFANQVAAEMANHAKSKFLAKMSHEIRTPMNSIMGFAELASDSDSVPKMKDYMKKITDSTKWLLRIINDILDISKIEAGKLEIDNTPFDLHDVFSQCQSVILPSVKEKGLDFNVYAEPLTGKKLLGDPVRLYQVLINLLTNAVKFTNTGEVILSSTIIESGGRVTVFFEVKDTGIGMTPEKIEKVFGMFIRADSSTTRIYGGAGLGLEIAKNIVELMGGKLLVESVPDSGSTFKFEIIFDTIDTAAGKEEDGADHEKHKIPESPNFNGLILVCDDNIFNQQLICLHLERLGLKTIVAENGKTGVEIVQERKEKNEKPFDLIFMDMFMPVMDGIEASDKIMAMNTGAPIVAMTANIMVSELEIYKEHGMSDCLGKPFSSHDLRQILLKYLSPVNSEPLLELKSFKG